MMQDFLHCASMENDEKARSGAVAEAAMLKTLAYFDIFHYPLTKPELKTFLGITIEEEVLEPVLAGLLHKESIFQHDTFYSLQNNPLLVYRRKQGNERAVPLLQKAISIGRFLYQFPFVKAVGISGSLSKDFAHEKDDIDFFIITGANRLWIARTLMHLFKKFTYLTGRQHYYCMNYFIDEQACALEEKNIFTAVELKTLLPVCGGMEFQAFWEANDWANEWFPACAYRAQAKQDPRRSWIKRAGEWMLSSKLSNRLDDYLLRVTTRRWNKKQQRGATNDKGLPMGLVTNKHYAKSNAGDFQEKVLLQYKNKVAGVLQKL
jgi:hypothetical protein